MISDAKIFIFLCIGTRYFFFPFCKNFFLATRFFLTAKEKNIVLKKEKFFFPFFLLTLSQDFFLFFWHQKTFL